MRTAAFLLAGLTCMGAERVLVHGHRGARAVLPENTLPAFEYAIEVGADVLEMDLAVTRDNILVVSHDPTINPAICSGPKPHVPIRELTVEQLGEYDCGARKNPSYPKQKTIPGTRIPTLDSVLALAPRGAFEFNIETKIFRDRPEYTPSPEDFAKLLLRSIRKFGLEKRVIVQSFDFRTLHAMKKLDGGIRLSALYNGAPKDLVSIAREAGAPIISPQYPLITKANVDAAHKAGLTVVPWTANKPEDWQTLVDAGVDAIITDDPAELIAFLKKRRGR